MKLRLTLTREAFERGDFFSKGSGVLFERVRFVAGAAICGHIETAGYKQHIAIVDAIGKNSFRCYSILFGETLHVEVKYLDCFLSPLN